jgi:hypothetical protein
MSAIPQAIAPNPHTNLLNLFIHIANKMGFQQKKQQQHGREVLFFQRGFGVVLLVPVVKFKTVNL